MDNCVIERKKFGLSAHAELYSICYNICNQSGVPRFQLVDFVCERACAFFVRVVPPLLESNQYDDTTIINEYGRLMTKLFQPLCEYLSGKDRPPMERIIHLAVTLAYEYFTRVSTGYRPFPNASNLFKRHMRDTGLISVSRDPSGGEGICVSSIDMDILADKKREIIRKFKFDEGELAALI